MKRRLSNVMAVVVKEKVQYYLALCVKQDSMYLTKNRN